MSLVDANSSQVEEVLAKLPEIIEETGYDELFGYQLDPNGEFYDDKITRVLLAKYIRANNGVISNAVKQLSDTLEWRAEFKPLLAGFTEKHPDDFADLGMITFETEAAPNERITTWNLYGKMDNAKEIFAKQAHAFLRWRVGLMEQAIQLLNFEDPENDYMVQVHDYKGVSMFKIDPEMKKVTSKIIKTFSAHYPEVLSRKFFVNVPVIMSFFYSVAKSFATPESRKKFMMLSDGKELTKELGSAVPNEYGGKSGPLLTRRFIFTDSKSQISPYAAYIIHKEFSNEVD